MKNYNFKFAGVALSDLGGVTTERPPREIAQYDFTLLDIPGRSGSEYIDNKKYKNVTMTRKVGFVERSNAHIDDLVERIIAWLAYKQGYQEFEDTDHPGMVTYAVLTNFAEVQTVLRRYHKATLKFSRVPFWYLKSALEATSLDLTAETVSSTFLNPYMIGSKPIIRFTLKNKSSSTDIISYDVVTGGVSTHYSRYINRATYHGNYVYEINFEEETAKLITGSNVYYQDDSIPTSFESGITTFTLTSSAKGNLNGLSIFPRWRCL